MTLRLYHDDSYLKIFEAEVIEQDHENNGIILDQTLFYPGGGGQPSDKGSIQMGELFYQLLKSKTVGGNIIHILSNDIELPPIGSRVTGKIDWEYRYGLMRTHTAMHVLCGVIFRDYGASVTGGNMTLLKGRMDFEFESLKKELVNIIQDAVNLEITKSHPVSWLEISRSEALKIPDLIRTKINLIPDSVKNIRTVEIQGLDLQADGGTHVRNTSEVGAVRITE
jgi:misacylated tRNA(Ala) deacylase